jgi:hypothetical protein
MTPPLGSAGPRAFIVLLFGSRGVYMAASRAAAKYAAYRSANEAGYPARFADIASVCRAPEFDSLPIPVGRGWAIDFATGQLEEQRRHAV